MNFWVLFRDGKLWSVWNSFVIASTSTLITMVLGTLSACSIVRFKTGGENVVIRIFSQCMLPPIAVVFPIFLLVVRGFLPGTVKEGGIRWHLQPTRR